MGMVDDIKLSIEDYKEQQEKVFSGKVLRHTVYLSKQVYDTLIDVYGKEEVSKCDSMITIV